MSWVEKIDCRAYGEANFLTELSLHLFGIKNVLTNGSQYIRGVLEKKRLFHIEVLPFREKISREDTAGWMREYFKVGLRVINRRTSQERIFFDDQMADLQKALSSRNIMSRFRLGRLFGG
jgi:hypothetical protein